MFPLIIRFYFMKRRVLIGAGFLALIILVVGFFIVRKENRSLVNKQEQNVSQQDLVNKLEKQDNQIQDISDQDKLVNTNNWKMYTDKNKLFSIKYPATLKYKIDRKNVFFQEVGKKYTLEGDEAPYEIGISVYDSSSSESMSYDDFLKSSQASSINTKEIKIDGIRAIQFEDHLGFGTRIYYNEENSYFVLISSLGSGDNDRNKKARDIYSGVLSTFKFLNQQR